MSKRQSNVLKQHNTPQKPINTGFLKINEKKFYFYLVVWFFIHNFATAKQRGTKKALTVKSLYNSYKPNKKALEHRLKIVERRIH